MPDMSRGEWASLRHRELKLTSRNKWLTRFGSNKWFILVMKILDIGNYKHYSCCPSVPIMTTFPYCLIISQTDSEKSINGNNYFLLGCCIRFISMSLNLQLSSLNTSQLILTQPISGTTSSLFKLVHRMPWYLIRKNNLERITRQIETNWLSFYGVSIFTLSNKKEKQM